MSTESSQETTPERWKGTFRLLLCGSLASMIGSRITTIAYPMLTLRLTGSTADAAWMAAAAYVPGLLVYLPAGALVDRWQPMRVLLVSESGRGVAAASATAALVLHRAAFSLLIVAVVIEETLEIFSTLAERKLTAQIVPAEETRSAQAKLEARAHLAVLAGRPLGGLLFACMPVLPFVTDSFSFVISITLFAAISGHAGHFIHRLVKLRARPQIMESAAGDAHRTADDIKSRPGELWTEVGNCLKWIYDDSFTRVTMPLSAGITLICQAVIMILLVYAHRQHLSLVITGLALAFSGIGGTLGSIVASRCTASADCSLILIRISGGIAAAAFLLVFDRSVAFFLAITLGFLAFTGALGNVELDTHIKNTAEPSMLARLTSVGSLTSFGASALGPVLGGALISRYPVRDVAAMLCSSIAILSLTSLLLSSETRGRGRAAAVLGFMANRAAPIFGINLAVIAMMFSPLSRPPHYDDRFFPGYAGIYGHVTIHASRPRKPTAAVHRSRPIRAYGGAH